MVRFLLPFLLVGCSWLQKEASETTSDLTLAQSKRAIWLALESDPYAMIDARCDGMTYLGLWDWSVPEEYLNADFYDHEYPQGCWNRDKKPCFETDLNGDGRPDSRSGCSLECEMGGLRGMFRRQDREGLDRFTDYADENDWVLNVGPKEYTYLPHLAPLVWKMQSFWDIKLAMEEADGWPDPWGKLKGYRGNVVANYIEIKGCVYGYLNPVEIKFINKLAEMVPTNPIYLALRDRYDEEKAGDQTDALAILNDTDKFPVDRVPEGHMELFDYGEAPAYHLWLWALRIVEGCP